MSDTKWNPDIKMEISHREISILSHGLTLFLKSIRKSAQLERRHLGEGAFSELEEYCEHLDRKLCAALDNFTVVESEI